MSAIDWADLHDRLNRQAAEILEALKAPPPHVATSGEEERCEVVDLELAGARFCIETKYLIEVMAVPEWTPLPGAGDVYFGVCNLHGEVLPLARLESLLHLDAPAKSDAAADEARLLVIGQAHAEIGVLVDRALGFRAFPPTVRDESLRDGGAILRDPRLIVDHSDHLRDGP